MRQPAHISIFLSMIFFCILSLIFVMLESARSAGARFYLQTVANASMDSLFSEYHKGLWNEYRLFGLEYISDTDIKESLESYAKDYMEAKNIHNLSDISLQEKDKKFLVDEGGYYLEEEILDYMQMAAFDFSYIKAPDETLQEIKDAKEIEGFIGESAKKTKSILKFEKTVRKLGKQFDELDKRYAKADAALEKEDIDRFAFRAIELQKEMGDVLALKEEYQEISFKVEEEMRESQAKYQEKLGKLSDEKRAMLAREADNFVEYRKVKEMRDREIYAYFSHIESNEPVVEEAIQSASDILYFEENEEEDEDIEDYYDCLYEVWDSIEILPNPIIEDKGDKAKENALHRLADRLQGDILQLVMPSERELSTYRIGDATSLPSHISISQISGERNPVQRLLIDEYTLRYFATFADNAKKEPQYEVEYLIGGKSSDQDNLKAALGEILAIRTGLNYLHILSDSTKREAVHQLSLAIMGSFGLPQFAMILGLFIIGVWALAEAVQDIKILLKGGKVPLWKTEADWKTDLDSLLTSGMEEDTEYTKGLDYEQYLRLALLVKDRRDKNLRMLDLIQINLAKTEHPIRMKDILYSMEIECSADSHRLFTSFGFVEDGGVSSKFSLQTSTRFAY